MSDPNHSGNIQPQLDLEEHDHSNKAKRVSVVDSAVGLSLPEYDSIAFTYPDTVTEVLTFKAAGVTVCILTIVYVDDDKVDILSLTKT